jgi:hypothetical protein
MKAAVQRKVGTMKLNVVVLLGFAALSAFASVRGAAAAF